MVRTIQYDPRSRYRQRSVHRFFLLIGFGLTGLAAGAVGYGLGYQSARLDQIRLKEEMDRISAERDKLRKMATQLMADSHSANIKYQQIEEQLQSELPQEGPLRDIVGQIKEQLRAGVEAERLATLIRSLSPPKNCQDLETRRFVVQTQAGKGADSSLVLTEANMRIGALGVPARDDKGAVQAWYDPTQPVSIKISFDDEAGPQVLERKNNLPISQVVVVHGREYRMTFAEGAKSFLKVTYESCDYP